MRKMVRKFMALTMVGVLMTTPLTAFAATGTTEETTEPATGGATGEGALEGFLTEDDEIFSVTLPTDDTSAPTFAFQMDPQNLLKATDGTNYTTTDTVLFSTKTGTSNELSITNNSQFDVDVSLTATMSGLSGEGYEIAMAEDNTFADEEGNDLTDTSLYLGLVYETAAANNVAAVDSTTAALTADAAGITEKVTLGGMPTNYEIGKDAGGKYIYKQISSPATATGVAKFKMVGACNPNADWSAIDDLATPAAPTVDIVWKVEKHVDGPQAVMTATGQVTFSGITADTIIVADSFKVGSATVDNGYMGALTSDVTWNLTNYSDTTGGTAILQLGPTYLSYYAGNTVDLTCTLKDGTTLTCSAAFPTE